MLSSVLPESVLKNNDNLADVELFILERENEEKKWRRR